MSLFTCGKCHRHLRADGATACRFCGAALEGAGAPSTLGARLSRSAAAAAAFSAALTVAGCNREAAQDTPPAPVYGGPPSLDVPDASPNVTPPTPKPKADDPKPAPQPTSSPVMAPAYGAPPPNTRP